MFVIDLEQASTHQGVHDVSQGVSRRPEMIFLPDEICFSVKMTARSSFIYLGIKAGVSTCTYVNYSSILRTYMDIDKPCVTCQRIFSLHPYPNRSDRYRIKFAFVYYPHE